MLRKVKKKIESEFTETIDNYMKEQTNEKVKKSRPKKIIVKQDKKSKK